MFIVPLLNVTFDIYADKMMKKQKHKNMKRESVRRGMVIVLNRVYLTFMRINLISRLNMGEQY